MYDRYGGYAQICEDYHGEPWLTLGPDRLICILCMASANIISIFLIIILNSSESGYNFLLVQVVILIYLDIVWLAAGLINPGIIIHQVEEEDCPKCDLNEQEGFNDHRNSQLHCSECQVCILDREHHCHMIGGCVGNNNKIVYYFFLLGLVLWVIGVASTAPYAYYML